MWKFIAFGIFVQTVIFVSLLDVYVYEQDTGPGLHTVKECPTKVVIFVVEGLELADLNSTLESNDQMRCIINERNIHEIMETPASFIVRPLRNNESVFGDREVFYVGPELDSDHVSTSGWETIFIPYQPPIIFDYFPPADVFLNKSFPNNSVLEYNDLDNQYFTVEYTPQQNYSENYNSTHFPYYLLPSVLKADTKAFATILMRFQSPEQFGYSSESDSRILIFRSYIKEIHDIMHSPAIANENNIYIISSSLETLSLKNSPTGPRNSSILIVWSKKCTFFNVNSTLDYFEAFGWINYLVSRTDPIFEEELHDIFPDVLIEGNILDVLGDGHTVSKKSQAGATDELNGLEALNVMLFSMNFMEIEYEAVVAVGTILLIVPWVLLLSIKAWKLIIPAVQREQAAGDPSSQFLDTACFAILAIVWVCGHYWHWQCRYFMFYFLAIILFRLCCEEITSLSLPTESSISDKLKIAFQIILFFVIVESLFWTTSCGRLLYMLFMSTVAAKIFQGAFSASNFKIVISLAVAALSAGVIHLCPVAHLPHLVTLNVTIALWMLGGIFAIKFMMKESIHDRFLMFLCLLEFLMASIFVNIFVSQSDASLAVILCFFLSQSAILPLLGGNVVKCRLLALSVSTASFFLFFSYHGEGLLLLAMFVSCFCAFSMDKASTNRQTEGITYFCIFPVLFYTVTIVTACELIMPVWSPSLFKSYVLMDAGVSYDFMTFGLIYFIKLSFLLTLLAGTAISSCKKAMELPCFFLIIVILNLVSFRTYLHVMLIPERLLHLSKTSLFVKHILMQTMAVVLFYMYPFIQVMTKGSFFTLCQTMKNAVLEPAK